MRPIIACLSLLCVLPIAAGAPVPKERAEAEKVIGTWKLVKSSNSPPGGVMVSLEMELTQGGKVILRQSGNGGPISVYEGEYKVIKNELPYSIKYPGGGIKKETLTIKKLTDTDLILVDPDGIQEDFERVKPKKEDPKPEEKKP
jgi:uncharacterized protein (TIGR03066 family)